MQTGALPALLRTVMDPDLNGDAAAAARAASDGSSPAKIALFTIGNMCAHQETRYVAPMWMKVCALSIPLPKQPAYVVYGLWKRPVALLADRGPAIALVGAGCHLHLQQDKEQLCSYPHLQFMLDDRQHAVWQSDAVCPPAAVRATATTHGR